MRTRDFHYDLPEALIAQYPGETRSASRLLHVSRQQWIEHQQFHQLASLLNTGDLLVFNDTRVIPARLFGQKASGGKIEVMIECIVDDYHCLAQVRASKTPKSGSTLFINNHAQPAFELRVDGRDGDLFKLSSLNQCKLSTITEQAGHIPLPPYITRNDEQQDLERYQTVYARVPGAVAAPTAGLHFDQTVFDQLAEKGINQAYVTLHVGAGTFQPVRVENIEDHRMHSEYLEVSQATVDFCQQTRQNGGRIIAVGTTAVRSLETASRHGELQAYQGETDIFISPGYEFRSVDAMITNFHLPESTLLMLVSAFSGKDLIMEAYQQAVKNNYRFFSYGDAMLLD